MIQDKIKEKLQTHLATSIVPTIANKGMRLFLTNFEKPEFARARVAFASKVSDEDVVAKIENNEAWRFRIEGYLQFPSAHREIYDKQFAWKRAKMQKAQEEIAKLVNTLLIEDAKSNMPPVEFMTGQTRTKFEEPNYYFTDQGLLMIKIRFSAWLTRYIPILWGDDQESDIGRCVHKLINHLHQRERLIVNSSRFWGQSDDEECPGRYLQNRPIASRRDLLWRIKNRDAYRPYRDLARFIIGHENQDEAQKVDEPIIYGSHTNYPEEYEDQATGATSERNPRTLEELLNLVD
jgi:hypothetical protein